MIFGAVLAGGIGSRMGNMAKPKQFLHIGDKPIIIHTIEKFCMNNRFDGIVVLCPEAWVDYTRQLCRDYLPESMEVPVICGGVTRNETIVNAIKYFEEKFGMDDDAVIVTHDAVRPFVTHRIIEENIDAAINGIACDTVIPATDTIVESLDGTVISNIPDRAVLYQGQTPQSFKVKRFLEIYDSLTEEEKSILTDAAKVFTLKNEPVTLVKGEQFNIKITYPYDIQFAEALLRGEK